MGAGCLAVCAPLLAAALAAAAVPPDPPPAGGIDRAFAALYRYDFAGAHAVLDEEMRARPDDPLPHAVRAAAYLFTEFERQGILELQFFEDDEAVTERQRLRPDPAAGRRLFAASARARELAAARLTARPDDRHALFALCLAVGTEADYAGLIEKRYLRTYRLSRESQRIARRLLALDPPAYDAYLTTGTAEYVVGSLNAFFRIFVRLDQIDGSKEKAVTELETVATRGHYLRPFAKVLLAAIHLRENRPAAALALLRELDREFPGNPLIARELARAERRSRGAPAAALAPSPGGRGRR